MKDTEHTNITMHNSEPMEGPIKVGKMPDFSTQYKAPSSWGDGRPYVHMTRPDWIAAIVRKKARIMGANPFNPVHAALLAYESGATAHRAIRVGVERAGWETDPCAF